MKKMIRGGALLMLAAIFFHPTMAQAAIESKAKTPPPPGVEIAKTLSVITGVAISPLLGVSAVGTYQYFHATPEQRPRLPWFANPLFWVPAWLLILACFIKDAAGVTLPTVLKKPFDVAETIEHKISGLVATGAFVPIMVNIIHEANSTGGQPTLSLSSLGLAAITFPDWLYNLLVVPVAMIVFFIVFLASNAVNVLILLSPFGALDALLKLFRTTIIASVAATAYINPWMGAAWALIIIFISYLIAGWSFRLSHFGLTFIWDFCTGRKNRFIPDPLENKLFLSRKINRVPARTYGKLSYAANGDLIFNYHPWLVLPLKTLTLPAGNYAAGRGIFYSEIMRIEGNYAKTIILLPPRYLGHEEQIAQIYHFAATRNVGIRAAWTWFKSLFTKTKLAAT